MNRLVFFVEEESMATLLEALLPRLFRNLIPGRTFLCIRHQGKDDLRLSLPRKIRRWPPGDRFVVVQDQDHADCGRVKRELVRICEEAGRKDVLVRVVCRELEAWYLGAPDALAQAYPGRASLIRRELRGSRYRDPDGVRNPAGALADLVPEYQKIGGARSMGGLLSHQNQSHSFKVFLDGIEKLHRSIRVPA